MFRFLRFLGVKRVLRERFEKRFVKAFGFPPPLNKEELENLRGMVMKKLVEVGVTAENARKEFEHHKDAPGRSDLDHGVRELTLMWVIMAANQSQQAGREYNKLKKLARRAGFSKIDLIKAEQRVMVEATSGLLFSTR